MLNYRNRETETKKRYLLLLSSLRCKQAVRILGWVESNEQEVLKHTYFL
jgi:hypothetical protein